MISQSGSLGIGSYGWVSRLYDSFDLTDDGILGAAQQLQSASALYGLSQVGLKFKDDEDDQKEPLILRSLLLNAYSTSLGVIDFYDQAQF